MPNRLFAACVGLLLVGLGVAGLRAGAVLGRSGVVRRREQPAWFWLRIATYLVVGLLACAYAVRRVA